jgi:hypothetical protein
LYDLFEDNARCGGWLILYTHDVAEEPSAFGCTPGDFERLVAYVKTLSRTGATRVCTVEEARRLLFS